MAVDIHCIENKPVSSNCFVIFDKTVGDDCIIVDPGSKDSAELINFVDENGLVPKYILLTHEHFDHCWGVNELVSLNGVPVICSALCAEKICDIRKNCSVFYDNKQSFRLIVFPHISHSTTIEGCITVLVTVSYAKNSSR